MEAFLHRAQVFVYLDHVEHILLEAYAWCCVGHAPNLRLKLHGLASLAMGIEEHILDQDTRVLPTSPFGSDSRVDQHKASWFNHQEDLHTMLMTTILR